MTGFDFAAKYCGLWNIFLELWDLFCNSWQMKPINPNLWPREIGDGCSCEFPPDERDFLQLVFVQIAKCIFPNCKIYLSQFFKKSIRPNWKIYLCMDACATFSATFSNLRAHSGSPDGGTTKCRTLINTSWLSPAHNILPSGKKTRINISQRKNWNKIVPKEKLNDSH